MHVKTVLSRRSGQFLSRKAIAPPRRKGAVCQFVATMGAPTKREVEVYVVVTERSQLASMKVVPTMPKQEVFVGDMEQSTLPKYAVMMDAPMEPLKEESARGMVQLLKLLKLAAMKDAQTKSKMEESALGMGQ